MLIVLITFLVHIQNILRNLAYQICFITVIYLQLIVVHFFQQKKNKDFSIHSSGIRVSIQHSLFYILYIYDQSNCAHKLKIKLINKFYRISN